jgi:hypothetical protein
VYFCSSSSSSSSSGSSGSSSKGNKQKAMIRVWCCKYIK